MKMRDKNELDKMFKEICAVLDKHKATPEEADALISALEMLNENRTKE